MAFSVVATIYELERLGTSLYTEQSKKSFQHSCLPSKAMDKHYRKSSWMSRGVVRMRWLHWHLLDASQAGQFASATPQQHTQGLFPSRMSARVLHQHEPKQGASSTERHTFPTRNGVQWRSKRILRPNFLELSTHNNSKEDVERARCVAVGCILLCKHICQ